MHADVQLGSGIQPQDFALLDGLLAPGETTRAIFAVKLFSPQITHLVITSARLLGVAMPAGHVALQILLTDVAGVDIRPHGFGRPNAVLVHRRTAGPADLGDASPRDRGGIRLAITNAARSPQVVVIPSPAVGPAVPAVPVQPESPPVVVTVHAQEDTAEEVHTSGWHRRVPTSGSIELPPDPRALDGLGRNHSFETAIADLVDNSIDASATQVLVRMVRLDGRLTTLYVVDNGKGIPDAAIDTAMTVGGQRDYRSADLGRFGLGLKAASFSQAQSLTVISKAADSAVVGRRWLLDGNRKGFHCDVISTGFAVAEFGRDWGLPRLSTGTVIRWDEVSGFPATSDPARVEEFITQTASTLRSHLGLVFHKILEAGRIVIEIDVEDVDVDVPPMRTPVYPINPLGYQRSGRHGYPKELTAERDAVSLSFRCHIWSPRASSQAFKLPGGAEARQGIYFYRRGRLLQAGGSWHGLHPMHRRLQLARVEVEIDDDINRIFSMNPEKSKVNVGPEFVRLAEQAAADDGTTFQDYFTAAETAFSDSRRRKSERRPMAPPGKGIAPELREAIEREIPLDEEADPIDIRWKLLPHDDFFELDRDRRVLWLNERYRPATSGERRSVNDAPLLKALLFLLTENLFGGEYLGPRDKDNLALYQQILTAAAKSNQP